MSSRNSFFLIQQAGALLQMPRAHRRNLWTAFDTIASHSYHVATIAYIICKMEWHSDEDAMKACTIGIFHDLAEARTGDHDFIAKKYNDCDEHKAVKDQFSNVDGWTWLQHLLDEYKLRQSAVTKCVKDADQIAQIYHERVLMRQGNKLAAQRFDGDQEKRVPYLYTESAKTLATHMLDSNPNERRRDEFVTKNYNHQDLTGELEPNKNEL